MSNARNIASGAKFVDTAGDSMTGDLTTTGKVGIGVSAPSMPLDVKGDNTSGGQTGANVTQTLYDTTSFAQGVGGGIGFAGNFGTGGNIDVTFGTINGIKENSTSANYSGALTFKTRVSGGALTERMRISSAGYVTTPNQPMFRAYNTVNDTFSTSDAKMAFNSTRISVGSHFDTSNHRFVAPIAGYYFFTWGGTLAHSAGDAYITAYLRKNGSSANGMRIRANSTSSSTLYAGMAGAEVQYMAANDYMEVWHYSQNGNAYAVSPEYIFSGMLIG